MDLAHRGERLFAVRREGELPGTFPCDWWGIGCASGQLVHATPKVALPARLIDRGSFIPWTDVGEVR